jgi:hypothetical protein
MGMLRKLWNDDAGFVISAELVLVATILVIGLIVGMVSLRNQIVQELVDVGQAIGSLSQSYCFAGTFKPFAAWTDGSCYIDVVDFCQAPQAPFTEPGGISVRMWPTGFPIGPTGGEVSTFVGPGP